MVKNVNKRYAICSFFLSFFPRKLKVLIPFHFSEFFIIISIIAFPFPAFAVSQADVEKEYPSKSYIVGIGEVKATSNPMMDKRIADVRPGLRLQPISGSRSNRK